MFIKDSEVTNVKIIGDCKVAIDSKNIQGIKPDWFANYIDRLNFSETAVRKVSEQTTEISQIINQSITMYEDKNVWSTGRLRKGMVVGSIQSGKTASMMGVIGNCLDKGTKIVILLSGTKISLWHQTLIRVYDELDSKASNKVKSKIRLLMPKLYVTDNDTSIDYSSQEHSIKSSIDKNEKVLLFVIPKIIQHILDIASVLHKALENSSSQFRHMLVIDDESDDASILDSEKTKTVPYAITRLWAGTDKSIDFDNTANENLFCTYLAYTATPQANILQLETNPLSPTNFIFAIQTPSDKDSLISYFEPKGIVNQYTGGEVFYEQDFASFPSHSNFIQRLEFNNDGSTNVKDGLMSYVVGAAINMLRSGIKYTELKDFYEDLINAKKSQVPIYSMVYHPASETDEHFLGKQEIVYWLNNGTNENFEFDPNNYHNQQIIPKAFENHFLKKEDEWERWIQIFNDSIRFSNVTFDGPDFPMITETWIDIKNVITQEIIPNIKIRVINSKSGGESRPRFEPEKMKEKYSNIPDNLSIFVAGNVLSRGLTIERLAVTIFARRSSNPNADTQMQMQRWFGYRGPHIPFCRIFMTENQFQLFRSFHHSDKSLKERIFLLENHVSKRIENLPYVLEGENYKSTSKTSTKKLPLRPNSYSQFGLIEPNSSLRQKNQNLVRELISEISFDEILVDNQTKGYVSANSVSSERVADFLDLLEFTHHRPSLDQSEYKRWIHYSKTYNAENFTKIKNSSEGQALLNVGRCPYSIAAYLRFWQHVADLENSLENDLFVHPTSIMWRDGITPNPGFFITIRSGSVSEVQLESRDHTLRINSVKRSKNSNDQRLVQNVWGTASGSRNQYDDRLFDYHSNNYYPVPKTPTFGMRGIPQTHRPSNHPAHLAIYFIEDSKGEQNIGIGISLPSGSPEHIRSMRGEN